MTEWRAVEEAPTYEVSDRGDVRNTRTGSLLRGSTAIRGGYRTYGLWVNGKQVRRTAHVLVMRSFVGPAPEGQEVRHLDGNPLNNHLSNLRYGTKRENQLDALAHGVNVNARKTHCPQGHVYDEENTMLSSRGARLCRTCQREHKARWARENRKKVGA